MADSKITDLAADGSPSTSDYLLSVDVSDTTEGSAGTNKKVLVSSLPFAPTFRSAKRQAPAKPGWAWWRDVATGG